MNLSFTSTSKINLYLDIVGKDLHDGYHYLESIFYEIPWGDDFIIKSAAYDQIIFSNTNDIPNENTVSTALRLFKQKFHIDDSFEIQITKNVPIGAGLGGGSGNAGYLLKVLASYYKVDITECIDLAQKVGSDVPFFLYGGMALVEGKGEKITPLPNKIAPNTHLLIFTPPIHSSTQKAFQALSYDYQQNSLKNQHFLKKHSWDIDNLKKIIYNIFNEKLEYINSNLYVIKQDICNLLSPEIIVMTGSGSSFILFYRDFQDLIQAKTIIEHHYMSSTIFIQSI
ncbi:MAG: 4-(cytidine 5'-diphospho)-2-C-methyl-D-erythritol kinase [Brevinema sp.]